MLVMPIENRALQRRLLAILLAFLLAAPAIATRDRRADAASSPLASIVSGVVQGHGRTIAGAAITIRAGGAYASSPIGFGTSDTAGNFSIPIGNPGGDAIIYVVVKGGDAGAGPNQAIKLIAVLGLGTGFVSPIVVNERTTVASLWAMAPFFSRQVWIAGPAPGLQNAAATVANLVDVSTGNAANAILSGINSPGKLNTLANLLAGCAGSSGPTSLPCATLFAKATPPLGVAPVNTLKAALKIARHPAMRPNALFKLAQQTPVFSPSLAAAPTDWTVALNYTGGGLDQPTALALDARGNLWVANYSGRVSEFSPVGAAISPAAGFIGGGLTESFGIAVDLAGNIWVTNQQSALSINGGLGSVTELASDGAILSGQSGYTGGGIDFPVAAAIDSSDNIWIANFGDSSLTELNAAGAAISPAAGFGGGGLSFPGGVAIDSHDHAWAANQGDDSVGKFARSGVAISPPGGFIGGGLDFPQALALDRDNNAWVANLYGNSLSLLSRDGVAVSSSAGYTGGGLQYPDGVAVDSAGNVWVVNFHVATISEIEGAQGLAPGSPISGANGFTAPGISKPYGPAIDSAGNLWTANFATNSVTEIIGVAAPVRTPRIGPPIAP